MLKYVIAAIALVAATSAAAETPGASRANAPASKSRHAVLDNIISRVQMDALISRVVSTDVPVTIAAPSPTRRTVVYAAAAPVAVR